MRQVRNFALVVAAVLVVSGHGMAQEGVTPGPEHKMLAESEGVWDAEIEFMGGSSKGTMTYKMGLGGLWLIEDFEGDFGGLKFTGKGMSTYDPARKKYISVWIDSMSTSPMVSEGTYDEKTMIMTQVGMMPTPDGKQTKVTLKTQSKDKDTRVFTMTGPGPDGQPFEMMKITYKRRK